MDSEKDSMEMVREGGREMKRRHGMQWNPGSGKFFTSSEGYYFVWLEDGTYIEVHPDVYNQQFHGYLELLGVKRTTRHEIMQRAEQEWRDYSRLMEDFAENSQQWLKTPGRGIFVEPSKGEQIPGEKEEQAPVQPTKGTSED